MEPSLIELAKRPDLRLGRGILAATLEPKAAPYALVSQEGPLASVDPLVRDSARVVVEADSLDEGHLERLAAGLPDVERVIGIGGGVTMDTAKYLAWRRDVPLLLAPSIVSVDASVTNTIALRRAGKVVYEGFVVAEVIVADLDLIAAAPARLNRAGVGDLLSIQTGRHDWALGARAGKIAFDDAIDAAAGRVLSSLYEHADEVARVSDIALEFILRAYVEVNALLLTVGHSGPEEGSEHYFGYAAEDMTGRSFVHGELIGLGTVLMSSLQGAGQSEAASFLDRCGVHWRPEQLGLTPDDLERILIALPAFVRDAGLAYSIIDEAELDGVRARELVGSIPDPDPDPRPATSVPPAQGGVPR